MKIFLPRAFFAATLALSFNAVASPVKHVLMISVDGMHALDLLNYSATHPGSVLARLAADGIEYTAAHTPPPADSFPGILALTTGGTPGVTGVYYDETYDRRLAPPGSHCEHAGTEVIYDSSVDDPAAKRGEPKIDSAKLPLDPNGCRPVYPHSYLRVNTIFEVARQAGGYTAWIDKHPVYEILEGPSGKGVVDLYTPEIGENFEGKSDGHIDKITGSIAATGHYDEGKVDALINEIDGHTHDGKKKAPVPTIFGLNLQVVNVGQKISGYRNAQGMPTQGLETAFDDVDHQLGHIVSALDRNHLLDSTLVIVTAKHGNAPIDPARIRHVDNKVLKGIVGKAAHGALAKITMDQVALIWLKDSGKTKEVADAIAKKRKRLGISNILYGRSLALHFPSPHDDSRTPDIVLVPEHGVIYAKAGDRKKAEHGGFGEDDTNVALLLSNPSLQAGVIRVPVATTEVAPTILASLGLAPGSLMAVKEEGTPVLPGEDWEKLARQP
jgi:Type I phosphodiesterase / nucleotide pyrophosphatase